MDWGFFYCEISYSASPNNSVNGIRMHYVVDGPPGAQPLVLVHGFPDLWYGMNGYFFSALGLHFFNLIPQSTILC
jgi:pimeloyl-ACP methyl ester carboxylesterase